MNRNDFTLAPMISDEAREYFEENFSRSMRDTMRVTGQIIDMAETWQRFDSYELDWDL